MNKLKWNIFFTIKGPAGIVEVPNKNNPVECTNLASLMAILAQNLPGGNMGLETVGVLIELTEAGEQKCDDSDG